MAKYKVIENGRRTQRYCMSLEAKKEPPRAHPG
jgi:hypothetical protein